MVFLALPKGTGCLCQATTTRMGTTGLASLTKLITKRPCPLPSPQNSSGAEKHPGWMRFSREEMAAGRGTGRNAELPRLKHACSQHSHGNMSLTSGKKKLQNEPISLMHCKFQGRIMLGSSACVVVVVELQSLGDSGCLEMRHHAGTGPQPTPGVPGQWQHLSSFWLPTKARGARALPRLAGKAHE